MNGQTSCFVVLTDETGRYTGAVDKALSRAEADGAKVILYDVTASGSAFSDPRPNQWAGEGEKEQYELPLDPVKLERLGRHEFALQVERARKRGIDAYGWLPKSNGRDALAQYAASVQATLVLVPADLEDVEIDTNTLTVERI